MKILHVHFIDCTYRALFEFSYSTPVKSLSLIKVDVGTFGVVGAFIPIYPALDLVLHGVIEMPEEGFCLTVMRSSLSLMRALFFFQEMVGSGCPLGGMHSITAGSPAATTTSLGAWRKSSLKTTEERKQCEGSLEAV